MLTVENSAVRIEMLGGLQVIRPGIIPLNFPPNQAGNLLGLLALHLGASRTREWLTSVLWPGDDPEESRQRLRQSLYLLRQELSAWSPGSESVLVGSRDTIGLDARLVETDARDFEELIKAADCAVDPATQSAHLLAALRLHKGDLLSGFYHECFEAEQRRFEEMYRSTYHTLPLRYEAAADIPRAIEAAARQSAMIRWPRKHIAASCACTQHPASLPRSSVNIRI
jgi:DNA-binding transcriptional activator of the SARP family